MKRCHMKYDPQLKLGEVLDLLADAQVQGQVKSREEAEAWVRDLRLK